MDEVADQPILAIDLGGTQIRAALVTPDLNVACRRAVPTQDEAGVDAVIGRICEVAAAVRADARADDLPEPVGIGISAPGPLDAWRGVIVNPPNLVGWRDVPLAARVGESLGLPTFLERDTNVAVMAEWRHGAARGAQNVIYITISTGIGGGLVLDGRPLIGPDGMAGEVGHMTVEIDGPLCGDGMPGHVEAIGSGRAIAREARALLDRNASARLAELAATGAEVDAALVARTSDDGDSACQQLLEHAYEAVGVMCASLVNLLNPEVIVLGGSIAEHRPRLREIVRLSIDGRAFPVPAGRVRLVEPHFGEDVSLIGSLSIVNDRLRDVAYLGSLQRRTA